MTTVFDCIVTASVLSRPYARRGAPLVSGGGGRPPDATNGGLAAALGQMVSEPPVRQHEEVAIMMSMYSH